MAAPFIVQKLAQLSSKLFGKLSPERITKEHLTPLINVMNNVTSDDVFLDSVAVENRDAELTEHGRAVAPVTCMGIHGNDNFTMVVFIVRAGCVLPLHDHPGMHGLLKVIHGQVRIVSYTEVDQIPPPIEVTGNLPLEPNPLTTGAPTLSRVEHDPTSRLRGHTIKTVVREDDMVLTEKDKCCVLSPNVRNFHEIQSESKYAAFLDILAPPYDSDLGCHYYKDLKLGKSCEVTWLIEIPQPHTYWCDSIRYTGPAIS